jgi:hypothetical protein
MEKSRLLSSLKLFLVSVAAVRAFSPVANVKSSHSPSALSSVPPSQHDVDEGRRVKMPKRSDFLAAVGTFVTGAIVSKVEPSHAANVDPCKWIKSVDSYCVKRVMPRRHAWTMILHWRQNI